MERREPSYTVGGDVNWCSHYGEQCGGSSKTEKGAVLLLLLLSRFSRVRLCGTPETAAHQAPLSLGFSRQEHWSGLPFPSPILGSIHVFNSGIWEW